MPKIGLDIVTGFVKCTCDHGSLAFPSVYVRQMRGNWTKTTEAVGSRAHSIMQALGSMTISPIRKGTPDARYQKEVDLLPAETMAQISALNKSPIPADEKIRMVVVLPYRAFGYRDAMAVMYV